MARIRHIAFLSDNPEEMKRYYVDVFGVKELPRSTIDPESVQLSDGEIFINIIKRRESHKRPNGFFHIGFHVDKIDSIRDRLKKGGFSDELTPRPEGVHAQYRVKDPENVVIDIAETCWKT